jgi:cytochrome c peroxidase
LKGGFIKTSTSWFIASILAIAIMSSAIYSVYFKPDERRAAVSDISVGNAIASYGAASEQARDEPIYPIKKPTDLNQEKLELGRSLFHDTRLSKGDTVSCASCHDLVSGGGGDGLKRSIGVEGKEGEINAPTVYNSSLAFRQFWDGRAKDLSEQAQGPIANPLEMDTSWAEILPKLNADSETIEAFRRVYGTPPNEENAVDAIVEFEKSLITPSRFDRWLLGDDSAISENELRGYRLFVQYGCAACHQGEGVGGNLFQRFGVMRSYYDDGRKPERADYGRFNITQREEDRYVFKVPTLRNVALTAPYFHDGSTQSLEEAVAKMGVFQLGVSLPDDDVENVATFLGALTGEELR